MASSMGPAKMVTDGLVLHLDAGNNKSYPGSGTVWTDLSSTATSGSLLNGVSYSSDNSGVLNFDGTNDYIRINQINSSIVTANVWTYMNPYLVGDSLKYYTLIRQGFIPVNYSIYIDNYILKTFLSGSGGPTNGLFLDTSQSFSNSTGSWVNITGTWNWNNGSVLFYRDGVNIFSGSIASAGTYIFNNTTSGYNFTDISRNVINENSYLNGKIGLIQIYNRALSANEVFQNYEATRERFNRPTIVTDDDARNFLNSANISSETQQRAVNDLVVDMKNVGLWGKMKAIYPFVGGTATTHKWNLKDPRDVDAAYRLTFNGGWTHSSTGATPNGTNGYANTNLIPSSSLSLNSAHLSYYSRTNLNTTTKIFLLIEDADNSAALGLYTYLLSIYTRNNRYNTNESSASIASTANFFMTNRNSSTAESLYEGMKKSSFNYTSEAIPKKPIYMAARNYNGQFLSLYDSREVAFSTIGDGLTDADATNLYTIVQKYQTTLGRQV